MVGADNIILVTSNVKYIIYKGEKGRLRQMRERIKLEINIKKRP